MKRVLITLLAIIAASASAQTPIFFDSEDHKLDAERAKAAKWKKTLTIFDSRSSEPYEHGSLIDSNWTLMEYDKRGRKTHQATWRKSSRRSSHFGGVERNDTTHEYSYYNDRGLLSGINTYSRDTLRGFALIMYDSLGRYLSRSDEYPGYDQTNLTEYEYGNGWYKVRQSTTGVPSQEGKYTISGGWMNSLGMPLMLARYFEPTMDTQYMFIYEYFPGTRRMSMQRSIYTVADGRGVKTPNESTAWFDTLGRQVREESNGRKYRIDYPDTLINGVRWTRRVMTPSENEVTELYRLDDHGNQVESLHSWRRRNFDRIHSDDMWGGEQSSRSHSILVVLEQYP
jgi:hypothetical protein